MRLRFVGGRSKRRISFQTSLQNKTIQNYLYGLDLFWQTVREDFM